MALRLLCSMCRSNCFIYTNSSILSNELEKYSLISFVVPIRTHEIMHTSRALCKIYLKKNINSFDFHFIGEEIETHGS